MILEEDSELELFTNLIEEFSITKLKNELEEVLGISNISPEHLDDKNWDLVLLKHIKKYHRTGERIVLILHY